MKNIKRALLFCLSVCMVSFTFAGELLFTPLTAQDGLSDNQIRYIQQLSDGRMVFTTNGNVNLYDGVNFTYVHRTPEDTYPLKKYDGHYRIYREGDSLLWIKDSYKLSCIDLRKEKYIDRLENYFLSRGVSSSVDDLFMDDHYRLWLLTAEGLHTSSLGLFDISSNEGKLQDLATGGDYLYLFYSTGEVVCYDLHTKERLYAVAAYPEAEREWFANTSLVVKGKEGFYQLRNGSKGGFFFFEPQSRTWKKLLEQNYTLNTLIVTPEEEAYISCTNGLWIVDPRNEKQQYLPALRTVDGASVSTEISTLFYDRQGGLWVGTLNQGLLYHHPSRYKFSRFGRSHFSALPQRELVVQAFAEDKEGQLFVRCQSGIYQYHPKAADGLSLRLVSPAGLSEGLFRNSPNDALYLDSRGWTWAGTTDGLKLFVSGAAAGGRTLYVEDGLSNNSIHAILEDRNGDVWVTTSCGISQIRVDETTNDLLFFNFNLLDGTLKNEYVRGAIFETSDGRLLFGGIDGFNILNPGESCVSSLPLTPLFTAFHLYGKRVKQGESYDGRIILSEAMPYTTGIELAYNQNFLTFEFSALNYRNTAQTFYRYMLEGVDAGWQKRTTDILQASYTNLPPGRYLFRVWAGDNAHQSRGEITEVRITIHAPWWRTTLAYIIYTLLFVFLIAGAVGLYLYVTKKKMEQQHKEEILLLRIRNLIEQCSRYEEEQKTEQTTEESDATLVEASDGDRMSASDNLFIARAMEQVEKNLDKPGYSVEQLGRDLCMDRTGLYRKLITLLDQSPSLFIRNIRLQRAAHLLLEGKLTVTEIAEQVGFSSSSYLSKCFQEMYGCRPSEYAEKRKQST